MLMKSRVLLGKTLFLYMGKEIRWYFWVLIFHMKGVYPDFERQRQEKCSPGPLGTGSVINCDYLPHCTVIFHFDHFRCSGPKIHAYIYILNRTYFLPHLLIKNAFPLKNYEECFCKVVSLLFPTDFIIFLEIGILIAFALQCCITFCCTTSWIRHMYTHIPSLLSF